PDDLVVGADQLHFVAHPRERLDHGGRKARLELQRVAHLAPGAPEEPARRGDRLLRAHAEHRRPREDRALRLRPAESRASAGLSVWNGLRPGRRQLSARSSSEKLQPRFCQWMPLSASTTPLPYSW